MALWTAELICGPMEEMIRAMRACWEAACSAASLAASSAALCSAASLAASSAALCSAASLAASSADAEKDLNLLSGEQAVDTCNENEIGIN